MQEIINFFHTITNSEELIKAGIYVVALIVFAENGFFFAFFLPGDYLLFLTGIFGGTGVLKQSASELFLIIFAAAFTGSFVGYLSGRFAGNTIQNRKESFFFKKKHIESTEKYFDKYGARTLIISKFLPIVRTFSSILAGISKMKYVNFLFYNLIGCAIWVGVLVVGGYYFGAKFPWIVDYVQYVILFFLAITTFTVIKGFFSAKNEFNEKA
jgi:membrane-associated protein